MRLDLSQYDFQIHLTGPSFGADFYSWSVSASYRFNPTSAWKLKIAHKGKHGFRDVTFSYLLEQARLAMIDPDDWESGELIEHQLKQEEQGWAAEQTAIGNMPLSHPVCPRCDRDLGMRDMNLTGEGIQTYLICVEHCDYVPTVYSNPYKRAQGDGHD